MDIPRYGVNQHQGTRRRHSSALKAHATRKRVASALVGRFMASTIAAAVTVLFTATPLSAHDQLMESTPSTDERLEVAPQAISLEFSGEILSLDGVGATIVVTDQDGRDWIEGSPQIQGRSVVTSLMPGMPDAGYEVLWRVVSSDGHPISGAIPFTIGDGEPLDATATRSNDIEQDDQTDNETSNIDTSGSVLRTLLIGLGGAVIALIGLAIPHILRRLRPTDSGEEPSDGKLR